MSTYRAHVGERTFDLVFDGAGLRMDGAPLEYDAAELGEGSYTLLIDGRSVEAVVEPVGDGRLRVTLGGRQVEVQVKDEKALLLERFGMAADAGAAEREIRAPMPGLVLSVLVEAGQEVKEGQGLVVLEAMKMENELRAPAPGTVKAVHATPGEAVAKKALLIEFE